MSVDHNIIVSLDIGTYCVLALVGEILPDGRINIIGSGSCPSHGMDKGGVNDLEAVVKSVQRAIDQAELMSECKINEVFMSLSGKHIASRIEKGMVAITDGEVTQDDISRATHTAQSIKIGDEQRVIHTIPQQFTIDYQAGIKNPLGLSGIRMEVSVHMIICHNDMARNITKAVERCGLEVEELIYSGLATSESVVTIDEKELGVCIIDIGAGTMDVSIWTSGALRHTEVISYAGNSVTNDIAFAFRTPIADAEDIKIRHGCASTDVLTSHEDIYIPAVGGRPSNSHKPEELTMVIEARYAELMGIVNTAIESVQLKLKNEGIKHHLAAGIVLTGGASCIKGLVECAKKIFGTDQVRLGVPLGVTGLTEHVNDPSYATAVGILQYARNKQQKNEYTFESSKSTKKTVNTQNWLSLNYWLNTFRIWYKDF